MLANLPNLKISDDRLESDISKLDSQSTNEIDCLTSNVKVLPGRIANAIVQVYEGLSNYKLVENNRRVLACLIRYGFNLRNPNQEIFIKKSTIARNLSINEATVYRSLGALEEAGLITRSEQKQTRVQLKTITYIRLTAQAIQALGLGDTVSKTCSSYVKPTKNTELIASSGIAPLQDVNRENIQSSTKKQSPRETFVRVEGKAIPQDLAWLSTSNGLAATGILKLMATAKKKGARLSDVVCHAKASLLKLQKGALYAYLNALLVQDVDHAAVARQRRAQAQQEAAAAEKIVKREQKIKAITPLRGRSYVAENGAIWTVEDQAFWVVKGSEKGCVSFHQASTAVESILGGVWRETTKPLLGHVPNGKPKAKLAGLSNIRTAIDECFASLRHGYA
ncbi:DNA-binding transcriptional ArsR family regulator [Robbsia andropogonis]|uniref:hypothetical protein n=1 Tax=Robbsia andropogonis TaxID=28092 RepID=UPI003D24C52C